MPRLTGDAPGIYTHEFALTDRRGVGTFPVQAALAGAAAQFRVLGRVNPEAPWVEVRASTGAEFLETMDYLPYIALEILAITSGTVTLIIADC